MIEVMRVRSLCFEPRVERLESYGIYGHSAAGRRTGLTFDHVYRLFSRNTGSVFDFLIDAEPRNFDHFKRYFVFHIAREPEFVFGTLKCEVFGIDVGEFAA